MVLCFGPEGTVALEAGSHELCGCCDNAAQQNDQPSDGAPVVRVPCCSCFDLPIGFGDNGPQLRVASASIEMSEPMVLTQNFEVFVPSEAGWAKERAVWPPPRRTTALSHIKTIILRV
jgi:hypothetical protein